MLRYFPTADAGGVDVGCFDHRLSCKDWGDEWVVLDGATGDCHLLSAACGVVLGELLRAPPDGLLPETLFARAFGDDSPPSEAELAAMADALARLEALGLARSATA